jgi:hypothetical protein
MDTNTEGMKTAIQIVIKNMMDRVMDRVLVTDPFEVEKFHKEKPIYSALVPDEIFKGSHFERRFVTPFGTVWEDLAVTAATYGLGRGVKGYSIHGKVKDGRLSRISQVLNDLEHAAIGQTRTKPDWNRELAYVLAGTGDDVPVQVICDVYAEDLTNKKRYAFELKAPLPNSDQTKVSKEKILKLYSMEPSQVDDAFYALPYNPYGEKTNYSWSFPARWFNMKEDHVVLIGDEFWEKIGGTGTYSAFISAINEIGKDYKERIYRDFLGIEPPSTENQVELR